MTDRKNDKRREERYESLFREHYPRVFHFFRSYRIADGEADDLAQDTFIQFWKHMDDVRGDVPGPYLRKIARNVLLNWVRGREASKRKAEMVYLDDPDVHVDPQAAEEPDYAEREQSGRRKQLLRDAIARLPESQRQCMELWLEDYQYNEIAARLDLTMDAVKTRIKIAKKALEAQLGEKIPEDEE
jgi:RNA polymerase sigma-70 factor (ECF subfamily)